jgi:hypothetical protein
MTHAASPSDQGNAHQPNNILIKGVGSEKAASDGLEQKAN